MKIITFVTGNLYKFEVAKKTLEKTDVELVQEKLETPEIQSTDVVEIASYSAKWACEKLGKPVALTDVGWYIEALNGFPGPFIKFINQWLTADDLIKLMAGRENRKITVRGCLAYCEPGNEPITFVSEDYGTVAEKSVKTGKAGTSPIGEVFIPDGYDKVSSEISREEMVKYWSKSESYWKKLADYLS
jgi:XTP/dITP diphosphohydrolase